MNGSFVPLSRRGPVFGDMQQKIIINTAKYIQLGNINNKKSMLLITVMDSLHSSSADLSYHKILQLHPLPRHMYSSGGGLFFSVYNYLLGSTQHIHFVIDEEQQKHVVSVTLIANLGGGGRRGRIIRWRFVC